MREICQSGSMSGNRNQGQAKPDCGDAVKAPSNTTGRLQLLRLFSTLHLNPRKFAASSLGTPREILHPAYAGFRMTSFRDIWYRVYIPKKHFSRQIYENKGYVLEIPT
jgi:hypothetical protein